MVKTLSVVATIYKTGPYLEEFVARSVRAAESIGVSRDELEIILVNDGCPAGGLEAALAVKHAYSEVKILDLSRNFGHHRAMLAGLRQAVGDFIFLIDSDLEEAPEWLSPFWETLRNNVADLVYGVQSNRKGPLGERLTGSLFYAVFNLLSERKITPNSVTARLMTKDFLQALTSYRESEPFLFGLTALAGFRQIPVAVDKTSSSPTSYTFVKKCALALNSVLAFSSRPLVYISVLGMLITASAFLYTLYLCLCFLIYGTAPQGWTSVMVSVWCIGGCVILCLGIATMYLAKIYDEVKRRPSVVIKKIYE